MKLTKDARLIAPNSRRQFEVGHHHLEVTAIGTGSASGGACSFSCSR